MKRILVFLFAVLAGTNLMAATLHVDLNSANPTAPYASRDTAATNIQTVSRVSPCIASKRIDSQV